MKNQLYNQFEYIGVSTTAKGGGIVTTQVYVNNVSKNEMLLVIYFHGKQ
jgi:hypothetical protein